MSPNHATVDQVVKVNILHFSQAEGVHPNSSVCHSTSHLLHISIHHDSYLPRYPHHIIGRTNIAELLTTAWLLSKLYIQTWLN